MCSVIYTPRDLPRFKFSRHHRRVKYEESGRAPFVGTGRRGADVRLILHESTSTRVLRRITRSSRERTVGKFISRSLSLSLSLSRARARLASENIHDIARHNSRVAAIPSISPVMDV